MRASLWIPCGLLVAALVAMLPAVIGCEFLAEALTANLNDNAAGTDECVALGDCPAGQYCRFDDGTCDEADRLGECDDIPATCAAITDPVCGCDNQTYDNPCEAARAGESIDSEGECG
ncbi:MAG TPA: Kazal-type serine protease inhibitor domain-containing protein [Phycisphaerae bacterium]|nr:Kazal-type serine protease inhibitor domain-containing protein [Phycisphaerae bacterium]